ncbi:MAG TPA: hypothetical protein VEC06_21440 [Paucimonas sp.]|nr:hypothetical protein [Paucimonas sp.]
MERDPHEINRLIGEFMELLEKWQHDPGAFDWGALRTLAHRGAAAYNDGGGPSFHALALDGVEHGEFHERFLEYSLEAGFDPFKLSRLGSASAELPVIDHAGLADAARVNPSSARMRAALMELARARFGTLAERGETQGESDPSGATAALRRTAIACSESLPSDLLEGIAPDLAAAAADSQRRRTATAAVDPVEAYLTTAEARVDRSSKPYG